jgi:hypothetical protein
MCYKLTIALFVYYTNTPKVKQANNYICRLWLLLWVLNEIFHNRVRVMVFNATFNNISVILWQKVLLVMDFYMTDNVI